DADYHGEADSEHGFDRAVDLQLDDDVMEGDGNHDRLEDERDAGGDVEVRRILHEGLPGRRRRQQAGLQREGPQHAEDAPLEQQAEAQHQDHGAEQMRDIELEM